MDVISQIFHGCRRKAFSVQDENDNSSTLPSTLIVFFFGISLTSLAAPQDTPKDDTSDSTEDSPSTAPSSIQSLPDSTFTRSVPRLENFRWFENVIFELENVFLQYSSNTKDSKRFKDVKYDIITSLPWSKFERGLIDQDQCRGQILEHPDFDFTEEETITAMESAMSWQPSPDMLSLTLHLQESNNIYAIGNLPQPVAEKLVEPLKIFKSTFLSSQLHERLPHVAILSKTLQSTPLTPSRTLYIGSHIDSIITARSFGFHTHHHTPTTSTLHRIILLTSDPIAPAKAWLRANAGTLHLTTSLGITVRDAFQQYCILDALGDKSLIYYDPTLRLFSWYHGPPPRGLKPFPPDVDCNSLACAALDHLPLSTKHSLMDTMLLYLDSSSILQGYFSHEKVRVDILMCVNGLALFHEHGRGHQLAATERWLHRVLLTRAYRDGTHYYPSADVFLYFVSRMLLHAPLLRPTFLSLLRDCILERKEAAGDALALACRIIAAARCGVRDDFNLERLLVLRKEDGSWDAGVLYRFTRVEGVAWHQGLTVALAVLAVEEWDALRKREGDGMGKEKMWCR